LPSATPARTRTTLAAAIVALISTLALALLSYTEHTRAVRPSTIIGTFLLSTLLFDIAHARTLWLRAPLYYSSSAESNISNAIAYLAVATCVVKGCVVLVLEALEKRRSSLRDRFRAYPPEATASIFNRGFFWWLNPLFRKGYGRELDVDDLFVLDKHLKAEYCFGRFQAAWGASEYFSFLSFFFSFFCFSGGSLIVFIGISSLPESIPTLLSSRPMFHHICLPPMQCHVAWY
jgi:hypothetical protein